jgi:hypothetical protein
MLKEASKEDYKREMMNFNNAWAFLRKYYLMDGTEEDWESAVNEASKLYESDKSDFNKNLILLVIGRIEQIQKERNACKDISYTHNT